MNNQVIFSNPNNSQTPEQVNIDNQSLSVLIQRLVQEYQENLKRAQSEGGEATIHVDDIASKVALFYEKIRRIIDWKEEHLVRRAAIERVLKRRLIAEISGIRLTPDLNAQEIAEPLISELIRGGHFPNDRIPQRKIGEVQKILEKYIHILRHNPRYQNNGAVQIKEKINFYHWIMEIAACEIEESISPPLKENALIDCMTQLMLERIQVQPREAISEEEKRIQTYIAVHRALFNLDSPIITYHLLKSYYPQWTNPPESFLQNVTQNIFQIWRKIKEDFSHPLSGEFFKICEKYDTVYLILGDILENFEKNPEQIPQKIASSKTLEELIRNFYNQRLTTLKSRLLRAAIYSTLSIFVASGFSLFIVEVPIAKLLYGRFSPFAMFVDIAFPTALMFISVAIIRPPAKRNLDRVIEEIKKIVYPQTIKDVYQIKVRSKRWSVFRIIIGILYTLASALSLALTAWIFYLARIPTSSIILDTMNVAVIVFAAVVIKHRSKELTVEEKTSFWEFSMDMLAVPIAKIGQWLSSKWKEYNLVSVFFSALIDMPFLTFIKFVESWSTFLKEKKAEIH